MPDEKPKPGLKPYSTVLERAPGEIFPGLPYCPSFIYNSLAKLAFKFRQSSFTSFLGGFIETILNEMGKNGDTSSIADPSPTITNRGAPMVGFEYPKEWAEKPAEKPANGKKGTLSAYALLPQGYKLADSEI